MNALWVPFWLFLLVGEFQRGDARNVSSRPAVVNIGAIFQYDSPIGRVAKIAIQEAVDDINSNSSILHGTKLSVTMHNSKGSGFFGMVEALRFMETDVIAIIGPQSSVVAHFPFFVRTTQSDLYQMTAVSEIVDHYGWKDVIAIFVDDDYGRNGVSTLNDKLAERHCRITYKVGIPPDSGVNRNVIMDILIKVGLMESRIIVLHVKPPTLGFEVFSMANYLKMMDNGYVWIATDWLSSVLDSDSPLPSETMDAIQGVLVLRQHTADSNRKKAFFSRWNKITKGSPGLNSYGLYAYDSVWLVAYAVDAFFKQGGVISFSNDSKIQSLEGPIKFSSDRSLILPAYDIINVVGTGFQRIGYWSNYSGLSTIPPETLYTMPPNRSSVNQQLHNVIWPGETSSTPRGWVFPNDGRQLRIGVPNRVSFKEFVSQEKGTGTFKGFCIDVFTAATNLLPYAVPYRFIPFGDGRKNPSYTELVNQITTGEFDAVVGDIAIVANRTKIVDFTQPFASSGLVVVAPFKKRNSGAWAFLRPFNPLMWVVTACLFLFVGIVVWILEHRINDDFRGPPKQQVITILWFSFSTMFFTHRENIVSALGRLVMVIWLFVVLIINSSYTASLTSILTVQQLSSHIKGIETLRENDDRIGYQVGSFAEHYLSEELNISKSRLVPLGSPEAYDNALKLGPEKGGVAALVDELPYVELFLSSHCTYRIIGQEFTKSGWGFAFPRDSPLVVDMSTAILALAENGDLQRIHDKWLMKSSCTSESTELESDRLHLSSFWGLFLIFGIACFIALIIYFVQILRQLRRVLPPESYSPGQCSSRSRPIGRFLSLMDEKQESSKSRSKKEKVERSSSDDSELGKKPRNI
ncbi:hypothetical protein SLA2020_198260 [Shorea laevis]